MRVLNKITLSFIQKHDMILKSCTEEWKMNYVNGYKEKGANLLS